MSDATPAYRGYRLPALYTLHRVLASGAESRVFGPEGGEDLGVFDDGRRVEVNQVKAYKGNLELSDLDPEKEDSFLRRAVRLSRDDPSIRVNLVSFGPMGPELDRALAGEGPDRDRVAGKLVGHGFSGADVATLFGALRAERVREEELRSRVLEALGGALTGVDPERAFDLLTHWLYVCAEERRRITHRDLVDWVNGVGRFLAERAAHHAEWFTTIAPIEDSPVDALRREELAREFYRGAAARYEHVLADLDVPRPRELRELRDRFAESRVVVLHAASGQGKTTLAYRYLREAFPEVWRFQVRLVEGRAHALSIAAALLGHAEALRVPVAILVDVAPSDVGWPELVRELADHPRVRVLVAVREEDWRRAAVSRFEAPFAEVRLDFDRAEAAELYAALAARELPASFVDFDDAWGRFGGSGPLLEFVHLVTQGEALRDRLQRQVQRLEERIIAGEWSDPGQSLLRLVSVASAFGGRLKTALLAERLGVPAPKRSVELLEGEYLVRRTDGGALLEGLHPVRSALLTELLTDGAFASWATSAAACLEVMDERDIGTFLLYAFSRRPDHLGPLCEALAPFQPTRWTAIAGITRALIWLGLREYAEANRPLIDKVAAEVGDGWSAVLDFDIADAVPGSSESLWTTLASMMPEERRRRLEELRALRTNKGQVFAHAKRWLEGYQRTPEVPSTTEEWSSAAEAIFWAGRLGVAWPCVEWLPAEALDDAVGTLPLDTVADLIVGLEQGYGDGFLPWLEAQRPVLADRFRRRTRTPVLEDDGRRLTARFPVDPALSEEPPPAEDLPLLDTKNRLHNEAMLRVDLLRRLFPDREFYACQGYGHRPWSIQLKIDDTRKAGIPRSGLTLRWLTQVNSTFRGIVEYPTRPADWREFALRITALREEAARSLGDLAKALPASLRSQAPVPLLRKSIQEPVWKRRWELLRDRPLLPRSAVDEWGLIDEALVQAAARARREDTPVLLAESAEMDRLRPLLNALGRYAWSLQNFHLQATEVMRVSSRGKRRQAFRTTANPGEQNRDYGLMSVSNLADARKALPALQEQARRLLGHLLDNRRVAELDRREADRFAVVWPLWHAFVNEPERVLPDPARASAARFDAVVGRMNRSVRRELESLADGRLRVGVASETVPWNGEPVVWITVDGDDAIRVHGALEATLNAIRRGIRNVEDTDLRRYALDFRWRYAVILPLVQGRSLTGAAWRFLTATLANAEELGDAGNWSFVPLPVQPDALAQLGLSTWDDPRLEPTARLAESAGELWLLASHVHDLEGLPADDGAGGEVLRDHLDEVIRSAAESSRLLLDAAAEVASLINALPPAEQERREYIPAVAEAVGELRAISSATSELTGLATICLPELLEWTESVQGVVATASVARLAWATAVLADAGAGKAGMNGMVSSTASNQAREQPG